MNGYCADFNVNKERYTELREKKNARERKKLLSPRALRCEPVNHQIIAFMSTARMKIIANVQRVTNGNRGNGAVYKF